MNDDELNDAMAQAVEHMLPVQQRTIAEAALAGVQFLGHVAMRRLWTSEDGFRKVRYVNYSLILPGGATLHDNDGVMLFEDRYEAAVAALAHMNEFTVTVKVIDGFKLDEGNEQ